MKEREWEGEGEGEGASWGVWRCRPCCRTRERGWRASLGGRCGLRVICVRLLGARERERKRERCRLVCARLNRSR